MWNAQQLNEGLAELTDCFDEFGDVIDFNINGKIIKVQPASDVPTACDSLLQNMDWLVRSEARKIGPSATHDDVFTNLAPEYRPQLFHFFVYTDGRAAVAWRIPFVGGGRPMLKSLMVALMVWNGMADSKHVWQMLGHGVGNDEFDVFLWGHITDKEKSTLEAGKYPKSLEVVGGPAPGFAVVHNACNGIRIPFER